MIAYYEILETEADVVRKVFNWYTVDGLSIGTIARQLTELGLPTRGNKSSVENVLTSGRYSAILPIKAVPALAKRR